MLEAEVVSQVDISKALAITGWMSERELTWLATKAKECTSIIEFGCYHGRSTRALADNIQRFGTIWAVDPWNGDYINECGEALKIVNTYVMPQFISNLKEHVTHGRVIPVRTWSYLFELPFKVDMIFIDGDHRYETVMRDIKKALKLTKSGGIISGHDYDFPGWPGVKKAVDELLNDIQVEDTIWSTRKY